MAVEPSGGIFESSKQLSAFSLCKFIHFPPPVFLIMHLVTLYSRFVEIRMLFLAHTEKKFYITYIIGPEILTSQFSKCYSVSCHNKQFILDFYL